MDFILFFVLAAAAQQAIVVTGSREPIAIGDAPVSATLIDEESLDALGHAAASDVLRLAPGVSVAISGPRGTQTQLRIRGAEANHTLLFIDGIRFNDPAAGNAGRFELLTSDTLSRLEVVRGPQSALWGSEALGGVIAAETADPFRREGLDALAEYGSLDTGRLSANYAAAAGDLGFHAGGSWMQSAGIDSFGAGGDRDGFTQSAATLKAVYRPAAPIQVGVSGHWTEGISEYDGFDPVTFVRADTPDETENRIGAARVWLSGAHRGWSFEVDASLLDSANRNRLGAQPLNSTFGRRTTAGIQVSRRISGHRLTGAIEHEKESFQAIDTLYFGGTDQDRSRRLTAYIGEWRAEWTDAVATNLAFRHDDFSAFEDATTFRAALLVRPLPGWTLHGAYGEGIAQPSFYDLYGFFPGSFAGNPGLRPEHSRGIEAGVRWQSGPARLGLTVFSSRLKDEIVDIFDPATFLSSTANAEGTSRRRGIEAEASYRFESWLNVTVNYTLLDAEEQQAAGAALVREVRRPRHSVNLIAAGHAGRLRWGAGLAYVGRRRDLDFDLFPAKEVTLDDYVLASLRVAWRLVPGLEAYARMENAFDADYQDVVGYNTAGRTVHAGLRLALGR